MLNISGWYDISPSGNISYWTWENCNYSNESIQMWNLYYEYIIATKTSYEKTFNESCLNSIFITLPNFANDKLPLTHVNMFLCLSIILISIFTRIKDHYQWLILNQALLQSLFLIASTICPNGDIKQCFVSLEEDCDLDECSSSFFMRAYIGFSVDLYANYVPYFTLFLLTIVRFFAVSAPLKFIQISNKKVCFIIIIYDIFMFVIHLIFGAFVIFCADQDSLCFKIGESSISLFPFVLLIPTLFSMLYIMLLIIKRLKYQIGQQRKTALTSLKVSIVFLLQAIFLLIVIVPSFFGLLNLFGFESLLFPIDKYCHKVETYFSYIVNQKFNYDGISKRFELLIIFVDSFIVLFLLGGYRAEIFRFFKFLFNLLKWILEKMGLLKKQSTIAATSRVFQLKTYNIPNSVVIAQK